MTATPVANFGEYNDSHGIVKKNGVTIQDVECDFSWELKTDTHKVAGKWAPIEYPTEYSYTLTIKKALARENIATNIVPSLTATPLSGTAEVVKAATAFGAAGVFTPAAKTMTTPSAIRATLDTAVVTTAGYVSIIGTDVNDEPIEDALYFPTTMLVGGTVDTDKVFKTVTGYLNQGVVSATGKIKLDGIAGTTTWTAGAPETFELEIDLVKDGHTTKAVIPTAWFKNGGWPWSTGRTPIELNQDVAIRDFCAIQWSDV